MALSDLQLSLIGLGALGIATVWTYNKWQESRQRKAVESTFNGAHEDVLLRRDTSTSPAETGQRIEPTLASAEGDGTGDSGAASEPDIGMIDPVVNCIARLELTDPVPAPTFWQAQSAFAQRLDKPMRWAVLSGSEWKLLGPNDTAAYRQVRGALQLADREGAVSDDGLALFYREVVELARRYSALVDLPPRGGVLAHAQSIDAFCASVDIQIAVNIVHRDGQLLQGDRLKALVETTGMKWRDGVFRSEDDSSALLFSLKNLVPESFVGDEAMSLTTHGITFWLDVPRVADAVAVFDRMLSTARKFAADLDGVLVDDHRSPLAETMLLGIRSKIDEIGRKMTDQGIPGGSMRAQRLFS